jgi:hypothetical protein
VKSARPETAPLFTMFANGKHEKHVPLPAAELCTFLLIGHCVRRSACLFLDLFAWDGLHLASRTTRCFWSLVPLNG